MNKNKLDTLWLRERFPWMGEHSGYDLLCNELLEVQGNSFKSLWAMPTSSRFLHFIASKIRKSETYGGASLLLELKALWTIFLKRPTIVHAFYLERSIRILPYFKKLLRFKLVATSHQPLSLWESGRHKIILVKKLDALIVVSTKELEYFEKIIPGRVHFIPHGIDTLFFSPSKEAKSANSRLTFRCIFSGIWLRDTKTLSEVIQTVIKTDKNIYFDLVIPHHRRNDPYLLPLQKYGQICWHADISDENLRKLYKDAQLLLLPLLDCTANNALLEAVSCGLPVLSTDTGGIRDYTEESFAELFPTGDVNGLATAIIRLSKNPQECFARGAHARDFVMQNFKWKKIARQTLEIYKYQTQKKFIILCTARTGSNMLVTYLNSHPFISSKYESLSTLNGQSYQKIFEQVWKSSDFTTVKGFKIMYDHPKDDQSDYVWKYLQNDRNLHVIHLKRKNMLRTLTSFKIAENSNIWKTDKLIPIKNTLSKKVSFSAEGLKSQFETIKNQQKEWSRKFYYHPIISVYYEDLVQNTEREFKKITRFFKVPYIKPETTLIKQNPESLRDLIQDYDNLKKSFIGTEWYSFFE